MKLIPHKPIYLFVFFLIFFSVISCKKEDAVPLSVAPDQEQQVLDSIYLYAKQVYYWNGLLPDPMVFNLKRYKSGNTLTKLNNELFDLSSYAVNPETGKSYEFNQGNPSVTKYSTIISRADIGNQSNTLSDFGYDYGLALVALGNNAIYVEYVIKNSSAEIAGIKRGMQVEEINGRKAETTESFYHYTKTAFENDKVELTLKEKPSYQLQKYTIKRLAFIADPVNKVSVLKVGNTQVGYISYLKFSSPKGRDQSINDAFEYFNKEGVKELIIDLRYNGGGDVTTCENFANLIAPKSADGKVMRRERYNDLMQKGGATILSNQPILNSDGSPTFIINGRTATYADGDYSIAGNTELFQKTAGLQNLTRVYFIVSKKTASASELLINCLRPYMVVRLVGTRTDENPTEPVRTFGKPIGFFPIKIKSYSLYLSLFQNLNANNDGNYFNGMAAEITTDDDVETDFGDIEEKGLKSALNDMGQLPKTASVKNQDLESRLGVGNGTSTIRREIYGSSQFQGIIKLKIKLKKMRK